MIKKMYLLILLVTINPWLHGEHESPINSCITASGTGNHYQDGWLPVIVLQGNFYDMGYQYGTLLSKEIEVAYTSLIQNAILPKISFEQLEYLLIARAWPGITNRQKQIFKGIADATGLSIEQVFILDQVNYALMLVATGSSHCSFIAAWGQFTADSTTYLGRNLDWFEEFKKLTPLLTVTLFNPTDGSLSLASISYAGSIGVLTGINDAGVFIELNSGIDSMGAVLHLNRSAIANELLEMLFDSETLETMQRRIEITRSDIPVILNTANATYAFSNEVAPQGVVVRQSNENGLLVSTNLFEDPSWGLFTTIETPTFAIKRLENLNSLGNTYKGNITATTMQTIMDQPLFINGTFANGATEYSTLPNIPELTVYSVVAAPASLTVYVRVPNVENWQCINLTHYFNNTHV